ncbi:MAG: aldehyde ferredoxin oxidoreductase family protein [Spirochaetota bacterium]
MGKIYGWTGKILKIDLNSGTYSIISPDKNIYIKYIGGRGLGLYYMLSSAHLHWQNPEMPLMFMTGPLTGTESPSSGIISITTMSPLTGTIGDATAGGKFATELKKAGWDGIIITGKAPELSIITIENSNVKIYSALHLKGKSTKETLALTNNGGSKAVIGPAAENGVLFSTIDFDNEDTAGRNGTGLVMADKNLKCIHVTGTKEVPVKDPEELKKAKEDILRLASASPVLMGELGIAEYGTGTFYDLISSRRMMPTYNFRSTFFPGTEKLNAYTYKQKYNPIKSGCSGCHILCKRTDSLNRAIPEYEAMSHFTALTGNRDIETVMEANRICSEAGMDTTSAASTIACYMEINGIPPGKVEILKLLNDITSSTGEGELLKSGSRKYAALKGRPELSMSVKGLEIPAYDPRGAYGMALAYATSTRGACHLRAFPLSHEILRKPVATDRFTFSGKARIIKIAEDLNAAIDSITACRFIFFAATMEEYAKALIAVTGINFTGQDFLLSGERTCYTERIINYTKGFTSTDDDLPERFFTEAGTSGEGIEIPPISRKDFLEARTRYYKIRGLAPEGSPTKEKIKELKIEWNL